MKKLNVGILGGGYMGGLHANVLAGLHGVNVAAVCSVPLESAARVASLVPAPQPQVFTDFHKMIDSVPLDALFICLPPFAHDGQFEAAARKGIHIFIEKPIALDVARGAGMARAAKKAGIITQVGYHMRYGAAVRRLKMLIEHGTAGMPTLFDGRFDCNSLHGPWWRDKSKCGGQVFEQLIHIYDLSTYLLGQPAAVAGFTANLCHRDVPDYTVEDTSAVALRFKSGALANISGSNCAVPMQWNSTFTVVCAHLTAHFANPNAAQFIFTKGREPRIEAISNETNMYEAEDRAFINAIRKGKAAGATIDDGLTSLKMVSGVMASAAANGKPVAV